MSDLNQLAIRLNKSLWFAAYTRECYQTSWLKNNINKVDFSYLQNSLIITAKQLGINLKERPVLYAHWITLCNRIIQFCEKGLKTLRKNNVPYATMIEKLYKQNEERHKSKLNDKQ